MTNKNFFLNTLRVIVWPSVILVLGLRIIGLLYITRPQFLSSLLLVNANAVTALGTLVTAVVAILALFFTIKTGIFDKTPIVQAMGAFVISTKGKANKLRDEAIEKSTIHTFQLINIGRGMGKNVVPSVAQDIRGYFLEAINPHSYVLPPNIGTKELGEILIVHGQRFVPGKEYELEFEKDRKMAYFYIHFEDYEGKQHLTKVKIEKVEQANGELADLLNTDGIEVWKVVDNIKEIK